VNSNTSNVVWAAHQAGLSSNTGAGRAIAAANEEVLCWDIKKGELISRWRDEKCRSQVTAIAQSKIDPDVFAVGYEDGSIRLWDSKISTVIVSFNGHKSAVTCFSFDDSGARLASGSKDTDIIIWDLVAEVGLFKLRGHKDQITGISFLNVPLQESTDVDGQPIINSNSESAEDFLLTTGKDSLIKLWSVASKHCIETHVTQTNGECWALGISPDGSGCITAGNDGELQVSRSPCYTLMAYTTISNLFKLHACIFPFNILLSFHKSLH
jgi:U3 small nucleolar RNA-associated protein 12